MCKIEFLLLRCIMRTRHTSLGPGLSVSGTASGCWSCAVHCFDARVSFLGADRPLDGSGVSGVSTVDGGGGKVVTVVLMVVDKDQADKGWADKDRVDKGWADKDRADKG